MMQTGFTHMANNLNAICGPRVLSNIIIRIGALTVGNIFMTVPSQSTTKIQNPALKHYLQRQAIKTGKILS